MIFLRPFVRVFFCPDGRGDVLDEVPLSKTSPESPEIQWTIVHHPIANREGRRAKMKKALREGRMAYLKGCVSTSCLFQMTGQVLYVQSQQLLRAFG